MIKRLFLVLSLCASAFAGESEQVIEFLKDMLGNKKFTQNAFLEEYCSEALLKKLETSGEYCEVGQHCYAHWYFRGPAEAVDYWEILKVKDEGDGWYSYSFKENKKTGKHKIHAHVFNGKVMLFDFKK